MRPNLVASLVFALMAIALLQRILCFAPATVDEPGWISSGSVTWRLVTTAAPPNRWAAAFDELNLGPFGNQNPPVGKFLIGIAVAIAKQPDDTVKYSWAWPHDYAFNLAAGNIPPDDLLAIVRGMSALFAMASLLLVYLIAREMTDYAQWIPLLAPVIMFFNPAFQDCATRVYTDVLQLFFTLTGIYLILKWFRRGHAITVAGALVFVGLACATKFSAGTLALSTVIALFLAPGQWRKRIFCALMAGVVPFLVFVAVNPFLWSQPLSGTRSLMQEWSSMLAAQQADPALVAAAVTDRLSALGLVAMNGCLLARPGKGVIGMPGVWYSLLVSGLAFAGVSSLVLAAFRHLPRYTFLKRWEIATALGLGFLAALLAAVSWKGSILSASLLVAGLLRAAQRIRLAKSFDAVGYLVVVFLVTLSATVYWLPFDWGRYYMPILCLPPLFAVYGAQESLQYTKDHFIHSSRV